MARCETNLTHLLPVEWTVDMGVDGVGNTRHRLSLEQSTLACLARQPLTAGYEGDVMAAEHLLLPAPDGCR